MLSQPSIPSENTQCGSHRWNHRRSGSVFPPSFRTEALNMGIFTKDIKTMEDLFVHGLQDIYYAEQQILKVLAEDDRQGHQPRSCRRAEKPSRRDQQANRAARKSLRQTGQGSQWNAVPGHRRHHQGGGRDRRRDRGQGRSGRGDRRKRAGRGALRNVSLRHLDRLGRGARSRRYRALPHDEPKRGEGGEHEAQHGSAAQGRQRQSLDAA